MWIEYLKERQPGISVLEVKEGFATYKYLQLDGQEAVYIEDIYVHPDYRNSDVASGMSEIIQDEAREKGCRYLLGTVSPSSNGSHASLKVLLAHGMQLLKSEHDLIWFFKEI